MREKEEPHQGMVTKLHFTHAVTENIPPQDTTTQEGKVHQEIRIRELEILGDILISVAAILLAYWFLTS